MKLENISKKKVLFITTKNIDYIRNCQEIHILNAQNNEINYIYSNRKSYFFRLIYIYFKMFFLTTESYDIIFVGFAPQLILPLWYKKLRNSIVVVDFFISLYDTLVFDRKKVGEFTFLACWIKKIDILTLSKAQHIIVDTRAHANYFIKELAASKEKIEVIYLEADKSIYYPRNRSKDETLREKFVVLYFGSILPLQGIEIVLEATEHLKLYKKIYFQIIGPVSKKKKILENDNIEYIAWLAQEELAEYIAKADLCLAGHFANDIEKAARTIPGKAYIYHIMKKKMILADTEANKELFSENDSNIKFVPRGDSKKLAKAILEYVSDAE